MNEGSNSMLKRLKSLKKFIGEQRLLPKIACVCCVAVLTACATDSSWYGEEAEPTIETTGIKKLEQIIAMQDRLDKVGGKLLISNADLCRKQLRNLLGFSVANKYSYSPALAGMATETYGLGERLQVMNVIEGSGAAAAGLHHGDQLLKIDNHNVPTGVNAERDTVAMLSTIVSKNKPVRLTVLRNKARHNVVVPLTPSCGFRIELGHASNVNAYSDGSRILITQGMMLFTKSDQELAYVIAKEMAHNVLDHAKSLNNTRAASALIDNLIHTNANQKPSINASSLKPMSKKFDIDADTLSLAMALRANYEIDDAPRFWKRLAYRFPGTNIRNYTAQHPSTSARLDAMPQSVTRIKEIDKRRKALAVK